MPNPTPVQSRDPPSPRDEHGTLRLNLFPRNILENVVRFLDIIDHSVTSHNTSDRAGPRRRNLCNFSLACKQFYEGARSELFKIVYISTYSRLGLFISTVRSRPETAQFTRELSIRFKLCGDTLSSRKNYRLCFRMYWVLFYTKKLELLELDLTECNCCSRNLGPEDIAAHGANTAYDNFSERILDRALRERTIAASSRTFLKHLRKFRYNRDPPHSAEPAYDAVKSLIIHNKIWSQPGAQELARGQ